MKKTFIFGLIAAALGFTACSSEDDLNVNDNNQKKGMVLRATVEQPAESRATFTDNEGTWQFDFTTGDNITVTNSKISTDYTFTNDGKEFKSEDAEPTKEPTRWYAFYPSKEMSFVGQTGKWEDLAKVYALVGSTPHGTGDVTGENGLDITMGPKVAILKIINKKGNIDINVKNSASTWVKGLTASGSSFNLTMMDTKQTLLSTTTTGTYYIAVPAGKQLAIKNGDEVIKSTGTNGLTAGKYYELTISLFGQGYAEAKGIGNVRWIQLWKNGPKFAECNVNIATYGSIFNNQMSFTDAVKTGDEYVWGANWRTPSYDELNELLLAAQGNSKAKVTCVYGQNEDDVWGFTFTGKEAGYTSNSVFFPCYSHGESDIGFEWYWSSTAVDASYKWRMFLAYSKDETFKSAWEESSESSKKFVRPVLVEE